MSCVEMFVAPVPTANKAEYLAHTQSMAGLFKAHGALAVHECWGIDVPDGEVTSFPLAVKKQDDETVVAGWVVWPSKDVRDAAWPKMMEDPRMSDDGDPMPFDGKRLIFGLFETLYEA